MPGSLLGLPVVWNLSKFTIHTVDCSHKTAHSREIKKIDVLVTETIVNLGDHDGKLSRTELEIAIRSVATGGNYSCKDAELVRIIYRRAGLLVCAWWCV